MANSVKNRRMIKRLTQRRGLFLIELMIVLLIVGLIFSNLFIPSALRHRQTAEAVTCQQARKQIQEAELLYFADQKEHSRNFQDLVDRGYLRSIPSCPSQGIYAWFPYLENDARFQTVVGCSIHTQPEMLTSLGTTFGEISAGFINLINDYFSRYGRYPRSGWRRALLDLGLEINEWRDGINGIIYRPRGSTLRIQPDQGYMFHIKRVVGGQTITVQSNQRLIYSAPNDTWYFRNTNPANQVDISTLIVVSL